MEHQQTLEDHLRRATRNFTARLPEDEVFALGADLARELARAHAETPPRHPDLDPAAVAFQDGKPRLQASRPAGAAAEDLFHLGALLYSLATRTPPDVSWRLDGPPPASLSTLSRRAVLANLTAPRRADRIATAAEAVAALAAAQQAPAERIAAWPTFRGDSQRSGHRADGPAATVLETMWTARLGPVVSSPVIGPGVVLAATADGRLLFLEPATGRTVHELRLAPAVESSPSVAGDLAWIGTDDGHLLAVDVVQGEERVRVRLGQLVRSSPLVLEDRVVVGVVDGRGAGSVTAVDHKGKVLWVRRLGPVFSSPALAGSHVLVGSDDGSLYALDAARGSVVWSHALGAKVRATPAVRGDLAVVGDFAGRLVAVRLDKGTRAWTAETGHPIYSSACLAGDLCVAGCHEGHLHAVEAATGTPRFEAATRGPVVSSAVAVGGRFIVGSTDGAFYLIDSEGRPLQRVPLARSGIQSSPAVAGDVAITGSAEGAHALRLKP